MLQNQHQSTHSTPDHLDRIIKDINTITYVVTLLYKPCNNSLCSLRFSYKQTNRSQSDDPAIFNIPMTSHKNTESNQLGVVAGPFGQMLVNKEQVSSRRGSSFSLNSSMGTKDKL